MAIDLRDNPMNRCLKNGILIYPVYLLHHKVVNVVRNGVSKKAKILANHWYLEVNNNGSKKMYHKPIGKNKILKSHELSIPLNKLYAYWDELLIKNNK